MPLSNGLYQHSAEQIVQILQAHQEDPGTVVSILSEVVTQLAGRDYGELVNEALYGWEEENS